MRRLEVVEIVEYKSEGHPDTLTDLIVESCATFLDVYYKQNYGSILHYNVDKALFLSGDCDIFYGGGKVNKIPTFILGGQITNLDQELSSELQKVIRITAKRYLPKLPDIEVEIKASSPIQNLVAISMGEQILANDTSFGVGYYPFSEYEQRVFSIKKDLEKLRKGQRIPIGESFKIMLSPKTICISAPLYAQKVQGKKEYGEYKKGIEKQLSKYGCIIFNPDFERGFPYLTLCGSSVECGDDGQVGRSNRYNGLITSSRPMTIEAYHGKNNRNHVGKLYQNLALKKAKEIYEKTGEYTEVILVSKIGRPLEDFEMYVNHGREICRV